MQDLTNVNLSTLLGLALKELARNTDNRSQCWLNGKGEDLHKVFKGIKTKHEHILMPLRELHFATGGAYPYSSELENSLDLLQQAGMIKRENPDFTSFKPSWHNDSEEIIKKRINTIFEGNLEGLKAFQAMVEDLKSLII